PAAVKLVNKTPGLSNALLIHHRVRHVQVAVNVLDVEGVEPMQPIWVDELAGKNGVRDVVEARVKNVDVSGVVGRIEIIRTPNVVDCETRENRTRYSRNTDRCRASRFVPANDLSIQGVEKEYRRAAVRQVETGGPIEDLTRRPCRHSDRWDRNNQRLNISLSVVKSCGV